MANMIDSFSLWGIIPAARPTSSMAEQLPLKQLVRGSSPRSVTPKYRIFTVFLFLSPLTSYSIGSGFSGDSCRLPADGGLFPLRIEVPGRSLLNMTVYRLHVPIYGYKKSLPKRRLFSYSYFSSLRGVSNLKPLFRNSFKQASTTRGSYRVPLFCVISSIAS